jgi:hypothetical protein
MSAADREALARSADTLRQALRRIGCRPEPAAAAYRSSRGSQVT